MRSGFEIAIEGLILNNNRREFSTIDLMCDVCRKETAKYEADDYNDSKKRICEKCYSQLVMCCRRMDMQYTSKSYLKNKLFARNVQCKNCKHTGVDFFNPDKGTNSDPILTELDHD